MDLKNVIEAVLNGRALLLTGSGVNIGVKTSDKDDFPRGTALSKELYKKSGIDQPDDPYDLQDAADTFGEKHSKLRLISELKQILQVGSVEDYHKKLFSYNWVRCYTTNYDEVPIIAAKEMKNYVPATINSKVRSFTQQKDVCVYVNGYIGNLNEDTLGSEFKLTGSSYLSADNILNSQWGAVLNTDLEMAECVIIIGLSLDYDLDLKRIINSKEIKNKTVFIQGANISEDKERKLNRLGTTFKLGVKEFVEEVEKYSKIYEPVVLDANRYLYYCFEKYQRPEYISESSVLEVHNLLMNGNFSENLLFLEGGKFKDIIYRNKITEILKSIENNKKVVFMHANLGNGKTIAIEILKYKLSYKGVNVFIFKEDYSSQIAKDVQMIGELKGKKVIIFEDYFNYIGIIKYFQNIDFSETTFILVARTTIYETKIGEIQEIFDLSIGESNIYDINNLQGKETNKFFEILDRNGLWARNNELKLAEKRKLITDKKDKCAQLQTALVKVIDSNEIKDKVLDLVKEVKKKSENYYHTVILALLVKIMSLNITADDVNRIMGNDVLNDSQFVNNSGVKEILDFSTGKTKFVVKSSIIAKMILEELDCNNEIVQILAKVALYSNKYSDTLKYNNVLKNIISYSHVNSFMANKKNRGDFLINYYDKLKAIDYFRDNSFFWLQFSIACSDIGEYDLAQKHINVAYAKFRETEVVVPFQIDNQQAKLYLRLIMERKAKDVLKTFEDAHKLLTQPVISLKDREEIMIRPFYTYIDKKFYNEILRHGGEKLYQNNCMEAHDKVSKYLKRLRTERDRARFNDLSLKLLRGSCSAEQSDS